MSDKKEKKTDDSGNCMIFGMLIGMSIGFALGQPLFNNMPPVWRAVRASVWRSAASLTASKSSNKFSQP